MIANQIDPARPAYPPGMFRLAALVATSLVLTLAAPLAHADDCAGRTVTRMVAPDNLGWVDLRASGRNAWEMRVTPAPGKPVVWLPLPELTADHAHLMVLVPRTRERFAVVDTGAEHHEANRVRVFDRHGKQLASFGLADLMTETERKQVTRSVSHLDWLADTTDKVDPRTWTDHVELVLASGRVVRIDLGHGAKGPRVAR